jgi:hypothetical protein
MDYRGHQGRPGKRAQMLKLAAMGPLPVAATAGAGMAINEIIKTETSAIRIAVPFW